MGDLLVDENDYELVDDDYFYNVNESWDASDDGEVRAGGPGGGPRSNTNKSHESSELDIRKFPKAALSMVSSGISLDKTIKKFQKIKTTYREKKPILLSGREDNNDSDAAVVEGVGGRSTKKGPLKRLEHNNDPNIRLEAHMKSLSPYERFKMQTWMSFNKNSIKFGEAGEFFDGCLQAVPENKLLDSLWLISDHFPKDDLAERISARQYVPNSALSWTEFRDLVKDIFHPFLLLLSKNFVEYFANEPLYLGDTTLNPAQLGYQRLVEKERYSKSRSTEGFGLSDSDNNSLSSDSSSHVAVNAETMQVGDLMAPRSVLHEKILNAVRKKYNCGDKDYEKKLTPVDRPKKSKPKKLIKYINPMEIIKSGGQGSINNGGEVSTVTGATSYSVQSTDSSLGGDDENYVQSPSSATSDDNNSNYFSSNKKRRPKEKSTLFNELQKKKISEISDLQRSYPVLWQEMKEKRDDERVRTNIVKLAKKEMLSTLNRVLYIDEKDRTQSVINEIKWERKHDKLEQANRNREKEDKMIENWETHKRKALTNKSMYKQVLDASIKEGVAAARAQIEAEKREKNIVRDSTITKLDSTSSSIVPIPVELKEQVKNAKSYKEFTDGKAAIKKYYEDTMDSRINSLQRSRSEAFLDSKSAVKYPISVSPIRSGECFFESDSLNNNSSLNRSFSESGLSVGKTPNTVTPKNKSKKHRLSPLKKGISTINFGSPTGRGNDNDLGYSGYESTPSPYRAEDDENNLSYDSIMTEYLDNSYYSTNGSGGDYGNNNYNNNQDDSYYADGDALTTDTEQTVLSIDTRGLQKQEGYLQDSDGSPIRINKVRSPLSFLRNSFKGAEFRKPVPKDPKTNKVEIKIALGNGRHVRQDILEKPKLRGQERDIRLFYDIDETIAGEDMTEEKHIAAVHKRWSKLPGVLWHNADPGGE